MMKYLLTFAFAISVIIVCGQQISDFTFEIQSKYNTDVEINLTVKYGGELKYSQKDLIIRKIHAVIIDSLSKYDAIEMYTTARSSMDEITNLVYKKAFNKKNISFISAIINEVKIPEELRILYENQNID